MERAAFLQLSVNGRVLSLQLFPSLHSLSPQTHKEANLPQGPQDTTDPSALPPISCSDVGFCHGSFHKELSMLLKSIERVTFLKGVYLESTPRVTRLVFCAPTLYRLSLADPGESAPPRVSQFLGQVNDAPASTLFKGTPPGPEPARPNPPGQAPIN